jgi:hypothetical protein
MIKLNRNIAISDTGYVFDPSIGESYTLNPIGLEIVELLRSNKTDEEIKNIILERYDVDEATFERYYFDFTAMLKNYQLAKDE